MTKLEELKAAYDAAYDAAKAAAYDTQYESRVVADQISEKMAELFPVSWAALIRDKANELGKQKTAPREPVKDEGNPIV